ncbi:MAG TPA: toprim domain-containing protein [Hyphomicrobiaceae bacterium]|nr:toprim domain-containing protein [Hyphomicrobiaceae bacterium]
MGPTADIAHRLAQNAEAVCREYLPNGRREGGAWRVGDIDNTPGRSLMVRLTGPDSGKGACGRWVDFATAQSGDLLDLIAHTCRLHTFRDVLDEARRFLSLPLGEYQRSGPARPPVPGGSPEAAQRLFASAKPIPGTPAAIYLRHRGIAVAGDLPTLRFHPTCFYRANESASRETWPALLAAVTDADGVITGVLRTWLARDGSAKAPLATPRRSLGRLLGSGARFGKAEDVLAAGEGLETMLSLRVVLPALPVVAALSATHLAAFVPPSGLRRLYIARDNDRVGRRAAEMLGARAHADGIEALVLTPHWDDFNTDLTTLGCEALAASLRVQLMPEDVERFLIVDRHPGPRPRQRAPVSGPSSPSAAPGLQDGDGAGSG